MIAIQTKLTPHNFTKMTNKANKYIVIHYVGAGGSAKNNADYFYNAYRGASANYFVDETSIWQVVKDSDRAWHCGGGLQGSGGNTYYDTCTNSNSIGIEMCCYQENGVWKFKDKTVANTVDLVKQLMKKYNIPLSNVIRHYDVTGKICPAPYVDERAWSEFKKLLEDKPVEQKLLVNADEITWELNYAYFPISDIDGFVSALNEAKNENSPLYWGFYKLANKIK